MTEQWLRGRARDVTGNGAGEEGLTGSQRPLKAMLKILPVILHIIPDLFLNEELFNFFSK